MNVGWEENAAVPLRVRSGRRTSHSHPKCRGRRCNTSMESLYRAFRSKSRQIYAMEPCVMRLSNAYLLNDYRPSSQKGHGCQSEVSGSHPFSHGHPRRSVQEESTHAPSGVAACLFRTSGESPGFLRKDCCAIRGHECIQAPKRHPI